MIRIKVCGITDLENAKEIVAAGVDAVGFIFYSMSPRFVPPETVREIVAELPVEIQKVGVFVNMPKRGVIEILRECHLDIAQLHGDETDEVAAHIGAERVWKAMSIQSEADLRCALAFPAAAILVDSMTATARGGTGHVGNWVLAAKLAEQRHVILAGGLCPNNVEAAVRQVKPYGIDLNSGVEIVPGLKDPELVEAAVKAARKAVSG